jgi:hypothetical protein
MEKQIRALQTEIEKLRLARAGVPGNYNASHAERKLVEELDALISTKIDALVLEIMVYMKKQPNPMNVSPLLRNFVVGIAHANGWLVQVNS